MSGAPARFTTASCPSTASSVASSTSPPSRPRARAGLRTWQVTWWPSRQRRSTSARPMKPVPPVTKTFIVVHLSGAPGAAFVQCDGSEAKLVVERQIVLAERREEIDVHADDAAAGIVGADATIMDESALRRRPRHGHARQL